MYGRPSRKTGSCREALPDVREWSEVLPACMGMVGMPTRMSGSVWEALPYDR